jgi:tight adherence protein B
MTSIPVLIAGLLLSFAALAAALLAILGPRPPRVTVDRRTAPGGADPTGRLAGPAQRVVGFLEHGLAAFGRTGQLAAALERAGTALRTGDFLLLVVAGSLATAAAGLALSGWVMALLLAVVTPVLAIQVLKFKASRRRAAFADQLDDSLQLLAGSLRAGHSLLRALDAVSREAEEPTCSEFSRIINETRVGRPLGDSLEDTARRMSSDDFTWVSQAIAIHREVGGDLAEVLDTVSHTIRERNGIRRQVKALSAEGRMSGMVLMLLPIGITGFLMMTNPSYLSKLTTNIVGWGMIVAAVVFMTVGALWLRKVVSFKF